MPQREIRVWQCTAVKTPACWQQRAILLTSGHRVRGQEAALGHQRAVCTGRERLDWETLLQGQERGQAQSSWRQASGEGRGEAERTGLGNLGQQENAPTQS